MRPYRWLWSHIGGRPWTYIMRDFIYQNPLSLVLTLVVVLSVLLHIKHEIAVFLAGLLFGHLFWGTRWHKGEKK